MELRRKRHTFIENSYPNSLMTHLLISVSYSRAIILVPDFIIAYPQKLAHKDTKHCLSTVTSHRFFIDKVNILLFLFVKVTSADEKRENPGAKHRDLSVSRRGYRYFPPE